jgi:hypothetical protein
MQLCHLRYLNLQKGSKTWLSENHEDKLFSKSSLPRGYNSIKFFVISSTEEIFNPEYSISPDAIYSLRQFAVYDICSKKCEHLLFQQNLVREFDTVQGMKSS